MPFLSDEQPPEFAPVPDQDKLESDQVFYIPFTGEILPTFEEYFNRMIHYQERVWSCSETKKQNLTFQEALESERKAIAKAEPSFPAVWIKPCLEVIHGNRASMLELVDIIYDYFRGTRFVSEYVYVDIPTSVSSNERSVERALIVEKLPNTVPTTLEKKANDKRQMQRDAREAMEDMSRVPDDPFHYRIQLANRTHKEFIVLPNQMRRPRQVLSKNTFKRYLKDVAKKEGKSFGAPWVVKASLVQRYGLLAEIPPEGPDMDDGGKGKKKKKALDLEDDPIEDSELLFDKALQRKPEEGQTDLPKRPEFSCDFGPSIPQDFVFPLLKSFHFLSVYARPLKLYPFQFDAFIRHLSFDDASQPSEIISESFGSLLALACHEYQAKFDNPSGINPFFVGGWPKQDSNGDYSSHKETNELISHVVQEYKAFDVHEKVAVDQWYKWRPGQWGHVDKRKKNHTLDNIKAWPVALFGLIKDSIESIDNPTSADLSKWAMLSKILRLSPSDDQEMKSEPQDSSSALEMDVDGSEIDELPEDDDDGFDIKKEVDGEEDELDWDAEDSTQTKKPKMAAGLLPSERIKPIKISLSRPSSASTTTTTKKKQVVKKAKPPTTMGFADLCLRMEQGVWNLSATERIQLFTHIIDELLPDSKLLSTYRDECLERVTELKKEQREINRHRRGITQQIGDLEKAISNLNPVGVVVVAPSNDVVVESSAAVLDESDASGDEYEEGRRRSRSARLSRSRKAQKVAAAVEDVSVTPQALSEEQQKRQDEKERLEALDAQMQRRHNIIDFQVRILQASRRMRSLGRDSHGSVSLDGITKIEPDSTVAYEPLADPDIPYDYSTGLLFIEYFGFEPVDAVSNEQSDLRVGLLSGKWGYFSKVSQLEELKLWLDKRGIRENGLYNNLEYYKDYIVDGMTKRSVHDGKEQTAESRELMDDAFGYENWWALL